MNWIKEKLNKLKLFFVYIKDEVKFEFNYKLNRISIWWDNCLAEYGDIYVFIYLQICSIGLYYNLYDFYINFWYYAHFNWLFLLWCIHTIGLFFFDLSDFILNLLLFIIDFKYSNLSDAQKFDLYFKSFIFYVCFKIFFDIYLIINSIRLFIINQKKLYLNFRKSVKNSEFNHEVNGIDYFFYLD